MIVQQVIDTNLGTDYGTPLKLNIAKGPMAFVVTSDGTTGTFNFAGLLDQTPRLAGLNDSAFGHWYYDDTFGAGLAHGGTYILPVPDKMVFNYVSGFVSGNTGKDRVRAWIVYNDTYGKN